MVQQAREKIMEFIGNLLGAGASAMSGGIFGLAGSLIGGVFKYFQAKQAQQFKKEEWDHESNLLKLNMEAMQKQTENELALASQVGSFRGLDSSIRADSKVGESYKWVNAIRSLFRPLLTTGLVVIAYLIFKDLMAGLETEGQSVLALGKEKSRSILEYVVYSLVFSASTAVVWWFGDRAFAPPGMKNR